jgi:hypothetical protein
MLLSIVLVFSVPASWAMQPEILANPVATAANAEEAGFTSLGRVVDDPTGGVTGFTNTITQDGRIWTDKSVAEGDGNYDFKVTFSALSQAFEVAQGYQVPADTVFVIDLSGSMVDSRNDLDDGRSRLEALVDALNMAISILMRANPNNRIAVVGYGGDGQRHAMVFDILPILGRYTGIGPYGEFIVMDGDNSIKTTVDELDPRSFRAIGGTPTQAGIAHGARILQNNEDTSFNAPVEGGEGGTTLVTRRPNIILMTDGEPTYVWTNYSFEDVQFTSGVTIERNAGNGYWSDVGNALLTILTAAYMKDRIEENYGEDVGFYTISLGEDSEIIRAAMNPNANNISVAYSDIGGDIYSMSDLLTDFFQDGYFMFPFYTLNQNDNPSRQFPLRVDLHSGSPEWIDQSDLFYVTSLANNNPGAFFVTETEGLQSAFESITQTIEQQDEGVVTWHPPGAHPDSDGWLTFSDVLGQFMRFNPEIGVEMTGHINASSGLNFATVPGFAGILDAQLGYASAFPPEFGGQELIEANATDRHEYYGDFSALGNLVYYADENRTPVALPRTDPTTESIPSDAAVRVELFPMVGDTGSLNIAFHVITALVDVELAEIHGANRTLQEGDQLIRWYIPAQQIPLRAREGTGDPPIRVTFTVEPDWERIAANADSFVADSGNIYLYTNRWGLYPFMNDTLAFYEPHPDNPYYRLGLYNRSDPSVNITNTAPWVSLYMYESRSGLGLPNLNTHRLGNNGLLTLERLLGQLEIRKDFIPEFPGGGTPDNIVFTILDGIIPVATINYTEFTNGVFTIALPPGEYNITKTGGEPPGGSGYIYLPTPAIGGIVVTYSQTTTVTFINEYLPPSDNRPALRVRKHFHDIIEADLPQNFQINITADIGDEIGPPNVQDGIVWEDLGGGLWRTTLNLQQAMAGIYLQNLTIGDYTIEEVNFTVPGITGPDIAWLWRDGVGLQNPGIGATIEGIGLIGTSDVVVGLHNRYTPRPITPDPDPNPDPDPETPIYPPPPPPDTEDPEDPEDPTPITPTPPPDPGDPGTDPGPDPGQEPEPDPDPDTDTDPDAEPPPAPQTGDERSIARHIVQLVVGLLLMGGVVLYGLRNKILYNRKKPFRK